jgi:hypothetical protein
MRIDEFLATTRLGKWNGLMRLLSSLRLIEDPSKLAEVGWEDRWFLPALVSARSSYQAPVSTGDIVLLESGALPVANFMDPKMGWSNLVKGQLLHYQLPGWHDRMFHDEGAAMIAEHLRPLLDRVDAEARIFEGQLVKRNASSRAAGSAHDGGESLQQRLETVHADAIVERAPTDFLQSLS